MQESLSYDCMATAVRLPDGRQTICELHICNNRCQCWNKKSHLNLQSGVEMAFTCISECILLFLLLQWNLLDTTLVTTALEGS